MKRAQLQRLTGGFEGGGAMTGGLGLTARGSRRPVGGWLRRRRTGFVSAEASRRRDADGSEGRPTRLRGLDGWLELVRATSEGRVATANGQGRRSGGGAEAALGWMKKIEEEDE
ncbi:HTH myb-type domain-containing protein [Psidium guajava]|nr:HTH myb-type domain-containing protein [Psidium guajava]